MLLLILLPIAAQSAVAFFPASCPSAHGVALQVLGSGGPIADDGRASSAYLVWLHGESRVLIDAGGGTFLRFAEARGKFAELDFIGLSHLHADHSADLPALLKSGNFSGRQASLVIAGPDGDPPFPSLRAYLDSLLHESRGAYAYLSGYLDGSGGLPELEVEQVSRDLTTATTVFGSNSGDLHIESIYVPHGIVPALGFRVRAGSASIVFASDQNGSDQSFVDFARDADALVMHMAVPENISGVGRRLHAPPSVIGDIANEAQVDVLVVSHFMARSLSELDSNMEIVRARFAGQIVEASDLQCIALQ
jgi:ribonuclease BN (tRNA processing enzyme)